MTKPWKPMEALERAIDRGIAWRSRQSRMKPPVGAPGEIIERMTEEDRAALQELTADNINVRPEYAAEVADQRSDTEKIRDQIRRRT